MKKTENEEKFISFDADDFFTDLELIHPVKSQLAPIIFVPGIAASKLEALNKFTGEIDIAWMKPSG